MAVVVLEGPESFTYRWDSLNTCLVVAEQPCCQHVLENRTVTVTNRRVQVVKF